MRILLRNDDHLMASGKLKKRGQTEKSFRSLLHTFQAFLLFLLILTAVPACAEMKIHFMDVGQGDSILVQCDGEALLVDAGPQEAGEIVNRYLKETVQIQTLDAIIATHEHDDHLFGMSGALSGLSAKTIYSSPAVPMSWWFKNILPVLRQQGLTVLYPALGDSFELGSARITFLNPLTVNDNPNNLSLVVRIDYQNTSALLAADIEGDAELSMVNSDINLKTDLLKVAHHGGNTSTSEAFLKKADPTWAVISVGAGNKHGHPHPEPLNNLAKRNITVYRTDQFGTVIATTDGTAWSFEVMKAR